MFVNCFQVVICCNIDVDTRNVLMGVWCCPPYAAEDLVSAESAELAALEYNRVAVFEDTALEVSNRAASLT